MTAEIAIMNLEAVALAADSAVTAYPGGNTKIFSSQNKVFALSNVAPVGILVYGAASFMSIPWETLIKDYRRKLGTATFPTLEEYASDFCRYLEEGVKAHVNQDAQDMFVMSVIGLVYERIAADSRRRTEGHLREQIAGGGSSSLETMDALQTSMVEEVVREYYDRARTANRVVRFNSELTKRVAAGLRRGIRGIREEMFGQRLSPTTARRLNAVTEKAIGAMLDGIVGYPSPVMTGLVVAGFGEEEMFPSIVEVHVEGLLEGLLKQRRIEPATVSPESRATIVPFAQRDMVDQFMRGIALEYHDHLSAYMTAFLPHFTSTVLGNLTRYSEEERSEIEGRLNEVHTDMVESFLEWLVDIEADRFSTPIMNVVAMLPKDQLAEMAEALVSLTSLKRRVSLQEETVGGPTDVALITKGDGLVWVRRKHYFPAELNPAYFARTYQQGGSYDTGSTHTSQRAGA